MDFNTARARSRIQAAIRSFFTSEGYLEVETPVLSPAVIPESPIELFETVHYADGGGSRPFYLLPSPELYMKKLLAAGSGNIFQLVRSFRNGEEAGGLHNSEFTMLEWYTDDADYQDSIATTERFFSSLADAAPFGPFPAELAEQLRPPFRTISVNEAIRRYAGVDLLEAQNRRRLADSASRVGLSVDEENESWEEIFNRLLLTFVEPQLPADSPTILYDYPAQIPALAKRSDTGPWLERWELYVGKVELANCYSEETDPRLIRDFFEREYAAKAAVARVLPDIDAEFLSLFEDSESDSAFPRCSGTALGVDRLVMLLTGKRSLEGVILFPFSDIL